jgi:hypothetical protein
VRHEGQVQSVGALAEQGMGRGGGGYRGRGRGRGRGGGRLVRGR